MNNSFDFRFRGIDVRYLFEDGQYWFVARDIAEALGYKNPAGDASILICKNIDEFRDYKRSVRLVEGDVEKEVITLSEAGMYTFCMLAKTEHAREFRKFVSDLIVDWRSHVQREPVQPLVVTNAQTDMEDDLIQVVRQLQEQQKNIEQQQRMIADLQSRMTRMESSTIDTPIPISSGAVFLSLSEKRQIRNAVAGRKVVLEEQHAFSVEFAMIYGSLNREFQVTTYKQIKSEHFQDALKFIRTWMPAAGNRLIQDRLF